MSAATAIARKERGQVAVFFALFLPVLFGLMAIVIGIGNWYTHAKHLQTKADAGAFAGGSVWGFPCGSDIDQRIEQQARLYVGPHTKADGTLFTTTYNPQVGHVDGSKVHAILNSSTYYDDDSNPSPADKSDPVNPSLCAAKILDVKVTEDNSFPLASLMPVFPDIKRRAQVRIEKIRGLRGLLPIAVRVPRPLSAAAVFFNEETGRILDVRYMCEKPGLGGAPAGLSPWTTLDPTNTQGVGGASLCPSWANFNVGPLTGVVVATSFRPACDADGATAPCLQDSGWVGALATDFCRQASGTVSCWDANGTGSTQTVTAGVQFIRGYQAAGGGPEPKLRSVYLNGASSGCNSYFNSQATTCSAQLNVSVDISAYNGQYPNPSPPPLQVTEPLRASDVQVRFRMVRSNGAAFCDYSVTCDLPPNAAGATGTVSFSRAGIPFPPNTWQNSIAIEVSLRNASGGGLPAACANPGFSPNCRWFYTGNGAISTSVPPTDTQVLNAPVQRSFSGSLDRTGSLEWTRLTTDLGPTCDGTPDLGLSETAEAASVPAGPNCFYFEMGLQGGIALDQDEPAIAFNLGTGASQRALIDCDPAAGSNLATEIQKGCSPEYAAHQFTYTPYCPNVNSINGLMAPHPAPWDASNGWPNAGGTRCVITQTTAAANQILQGFNLRLFGVSNNPTCPSDTSLYQAGRNYWHDANTNYVDASGKTDQFTFAQDSPAPPRGNRLKSDDPRLVTLFFTPYDSFTSPGNEVFPVVGFGSFYVTGYGRTTGGGGNWQGGAPEDPCTTGNVGALDGLPYGVGNEPPPDLNLSGGNTTWVWGHFVNPVFLEGATPSGELCAPGTSFDPCVAVLVE